jgi:hypothetical protein
MHRRDTSNCRGPGVSRHAWLLLLLPVLGAEVRAETIVWRLEDPHRIGGYVTEILGAPSRVETEHGPAMTFDGIAAGILLPLNPVAGWPRFTIEVLVRPEAGGAFEQRFLHLGEPNGARALLELRLREDGRWYLDSFIKNGTGQLVLVDETKLHAAGEWHWVALRYDGQRMAQFVNGELELERALAVPPLPPGRTSLGVRQTRVSWFKGAIHAVHFHDTALPPEKLQGVRQAPPAGW